jgi:hypothetical protein
MKRVNPVGSAFRSIQQIHRRTYSVAGPNSLWHIDGNHKLIRLKTTIAATNRNISSAYKNTSTVSDPYLNQAFCTFFGI